MKKIITLFSVLLFGVGSIFAQSAWEVVVSWDIGSCVFSVPPEATEGFQVGLTIYDVANDIIVVDNAGNTEATTASTSTFNVQTAVQAHCNDNTLQNTPSFNVYAKVWMGDSGPPKVLYCTSKVTVPGKTCANFSSNWIPAFVGTLQ